VRHLKQLETVMARTEKYGLQVDDKLVDFVEANALPGIDVSLTLSGRVCQGLFQLWVQ